MNSLLRRIALAVGLGLCLIRNGSHAALVDGLVGYWPLDALDASDASGNGLDGIVQGDVLATEDRLGNAEGAMLFPGQSDSFVDLGDDVAFQLTGAMTLSAWVVLDSFNTNNGRIVSKQAGGGGRSWSLNIEAAGSPGTFQIAPDGGTVFGINDLDPLPMDEWVHLVGVFRPGTSLELYINGELKVAETLGVPSEQFSDNGQPVLIGARNQCGNCGWLGAIDDVAIWGRDLSPDEVSQLFREGIIMDGVLPGDFNRNGMLDSGDLDLLAQAQSTGDPAFDLTGDGRTDITDRQTWVKDVRKTWMGDSNLDGEFNSTDFVQVFQAGRFETQQGASWSQGDWNGDGRFESADFVIAFQDGGFERGPRAAAAVPEPSGLAGLLAGTVMLSTFRGWRRSAAARRGS